VATPGSAERGGDPRKRWSPGTLRAIARGDISDGDGFEYLLAVAENRRRNRRVLTDLLELAASASLLPVLAEGLDRGSAPRPGDGETPFSMIPRSVYLSLRCDGCLRLYGLIDLQGWVPEVPPYRGLNGLMGDCGWQPSTLKGHIRHLVEAGLLAVSPRLPDKGDGWGEVTYRIIHNPARASTSFPVTTKGVWSPEGPPTRWRSPSRWPQSDTDALRDAPSVREGEPRETLEEEGGSDTDAWCDAPSVGEALSEVVQHATSGGAAH